MEKLKAIERLQDSFNKIPGVGRKSAEKMAYSILDMPMEDVDEFTKALLEVKKSIKTCPKCGNYIENNTCPICDNDSRDKTTIMVVSYPKDILAIEKAETYKGMYHVLNGTISISKGIGLENLTIDALQNRLESENIKELILATPPTIDGETTALYLAKLFANLNITITRIAYGLPMGGSLDYTDTLTISKALEGRNKI